MGLIVTRIYELIEFYSEVRFKVLTEKFVETRRKGDRDAKLQVVALTKTTNKHVEIFMSFNFLNFIF